MSHPLLQTMLLGALTVAFHLIEIESFQSNANILRPAPRPRRWSASPIDEGNHDETLDPPDADAPTRADAGSDLTDRFKYKVRRARCSPFSFSRP